MKIFSDFVRGLLFAMTPLMGVQDLSDKGWVGVSIHKQLGEFVGFHLWIDTVYCIYIYMNVGRSFVDETHFELILMFG